MVMCKDKQRYTGILVYSNILRIYKLKFCQNRALNKYYNYISYKAVVYQLFHIFVLALKCQPCPNFDSRVDSKICKYFH